jgi:hypothetical protein
MYKIIGADGREYGPVTAEQLRQWIAEGRANAQSKVQIEGSSDWRPLSASPEFVHLSASSLPPVSPIAPLEILGRNPARTNGLAVAGFIIGLLALVFGWSCCAPLFATLGIVLSCVGISQINKNPTEQTGKGLAVAGLVLSILGIVLYLVIAIFFGVLGMIGEALSK